MIPGKPLTLTSDFFNDPIGKDLVFGDDTYRVMGVEAKEEGKVTYRIIKHQKPHGRKPKA